jgi:hypothetical protein
MVHAPQRDQRGQRRARRRQPPGRGRRRQGEQYQRTEQIRSDAEALPLEQAADQHRRDQPQQPGQPGRGQDQADPQSNARHVQLDGQIDDQHRAGQAVAQGPEHAVPIGQPPRAAAVGNGQSGVFGVRRFIAAFFV